MPTLFTKIIRREVAADIIYEDDDVLAFRDIAPKAPVHVLIIPKREIASLADLQPADGDLMGQCIIAARNIAQSEGIAQSGYRLVCNCGVDGGQEVPHLHFHLMGGQKL